MYKEEISLAINGQVLQEKDGIIRKAGILKW